MKFILALLEVGVAIALVFFVVTSIGRFFLRSLRLGIPDQVSPSEAWVGLSLSIVALEFSQLFLPINYQVTFFFIVFAFIYSVIFDSRAWLTSFFETLKFLKTFPIQSAALGIIALLIISGAFPLMGNYDSGLYHFGSIRWLNEEPIIPGLANIHSRFGFNQGYFGFVALLNFFPYWNKGYAISAPFLSLLTIWWICDLPWPKIRSGWVALVGLLLITASLTIDLSSPSPDWPVNFLQVAIFVTLVKLCTFDPFTEQNIDHQRSIVLLLLLCICLIETKLSGLVFSTCAILVTVNFWLKLLSCNKRLFIGLIYFSVFAISLHLFRGFLLSGYPLYPSMLFGSPNLPWSVPLETVKNEADWIVSMARRGGSPEGVVGNWMWYLPWIQQNWVVPWAQAFPLMKGWAVLAGGGLLFILAQLIQFFKKHSLNKQIYFFQKFAILYIFSVLYWFLSAPDLRFLGVLHLLFFIVALWYFVSSIGLPDWGFGERLVKSPALIIGFFLAGVYMGLIFLNKTDIKYGWHELPNPSTLQKVSEYGIIQNIPTTGESCWNSELPCTPYFEKNLNMEMVFSLFPRPMYFLSR